MLRGSLGAICLFCLSGQVVQAGISGTVFHDTNANGTLDAAAVVPESGVASVVITATNASGVSVTTNSAANGSYSFPDSGVTASGEVVRVEFSNLPAYMNAGVAAYGTVMRFVTSGAGATDVNLALSYAADYSEVNPKMAAPMFAASELGGLDNVMMFSYLNEGTSTQDATGIATSSQVGALWGVAYSRSQKLLYTSAVLKSHVPLGSEGLDAIYTIDPFSGTPNATPWLELTDDLGIAVSGVAANPQYLTNTARGLGSYPQNDTSAFSDVLTVGIGDIELSADEKTLYVVNVYDKKLYEIDIASKTSTVSHAIPDPGCTSGNARPWALGERRGEIYVGVTCDGSGSGNPASLTDNAGVSNLKAEVYRLDGAAFTKVLDFALDYPREAPFAYTDNCKDINRWQPWSNVMPALCADGNVSYPTPLLADIEFDDTGDMILGFTDRTGFQIGHDNYGPTGTTLYGTYASGDILKACKTASGWGVEGTVAGCASSGGLSINQLDSDGYPMSWGEILDKAGEFYEGDFFHGDGNPDGSGLSYFPGHPEVMVGGLAVVPGTGEVMGASYDPVTGGANYGSGGVTILDNTTGQRPRNGFQLYINTVDENHTASKGVGIGDLEVLSAPPPVEVGNRIWRDTDEDGIQDADEPGIDGVDVVLTCGADTATVTSANGGEFLFSSATNAAFLSVGDECTISVANGQTALDGLVVTMPDAEGATDNNPVTDVRDSDATAAGDIVFTVGVIGENNHSLDIGYQLMPPLPDMELSKTIDKATAARGDQVVYTLTLSNAGAGDATGLEVEDRLPAGVSYVSDNPEQGTYNPVDGIWDVGSVAAGATVTLTITVKVD